MVVFFFYLAAICLLFAICAGIADLIGHLYPDWLSPDDQLEDDE